MREVQDLRGMEGSTQRMEDTFTAVVGIGKPTGREGALHAQHWVGEQKRRHPQHCE